ncbi:Long-chain fatty acid transport protein 1 [Armadillidium nasatum]|uniref:Long-chain fatty acid transport protein 1 n=1 Tax=Armadillidium nasatum TaxID=96803 RepID=A0A5N5SRF6_9CRUS|nr:Long-chain fatty acid transport protein 1 [Armadillidium nasatum]
MFGNGVRPQIWNEFTERFNMPRIAEFYGATEGIANIMNIEGKPGACGFLSVLFPMFYPARLIRVDPETGEAIRDSRGLCIVCKPGEPGEFVGKIRDTPLGDFHGYADKKASEKKVIHDVFQKGDSAFASGDILEMDEFGYVYFKDRMGDTFRWRGENVSTTEVEGVVSMVAKHKDAVVYGVEVPNTEGRAGMAAIVDPEKEVDMDKLSKELPTYLARTFKLKKVALLKEGFNPQEIKDQIYFLDAKKKAYVPLTEELYKKIMDGKAGL